MCDVNAHLCPDEFEDEVVVEKLTPISQPQTKSDTSASIADDTSGVKEPRKESRRISVGGTERRKRAREEEYVPQPVRVDLMRS